MGALPGFKASVYLSTIPSLNFTNLVLTDAGDHKTFSTPTAQAAKRYWDQSQPLTVQTTPDGTTYTTVTSGFSIQYVGGVVTFASALTGAAPGVRISTGYYMPYSVVARAKSVEINNLLDIIDITDFSSGGWKTKLASLAGAEYKLGQWWVDNFYLSALRSRLIVSAYSGRNANQRLEGFAFIKDDSIKIAVNNAIEEEISFESDGATYAINL